MAITPTKTLYITVDLNSCGNAIAQRLRNSRINGGFNTTCEVAGDILQNLPQYGAVIKAEVLGSDGTAASGTVTFAGVAASKTYTPATSGAATVTINGTQFNAAFDTDADTTVNNLIALIQADTVINALVTVALASHTMTCVAKTKGADGNTITIAETGNGSWAGGATALSGGGPSGSQGNVVVNGHTVAVSVTALSGLQAAADEMAAQINADAAAGLLVAAVGSVVAGDAVVTLTAKVPPSIAEVGSKMTLTANTGTASGATLSGGVNSSIAQGSM